MQQSKPVACPKHGKSEGDCDEKDTRNISDLMDRLPDSQGFPGRHKCAYCGYKLGFDAGYAAALNALEEHIQDLKS